MSKNSLGRFPSVRNNLAKRQSLKQGLLATTSSKQQYGSENGLSDKKILENLTQNQISKKIQNKIRMRKASGSQKKLKDTCNGLQNLASQSIQDPIQDLKQKIQSLWENSQAIYDILSQSQTAQSRNQVKQQIFRQLSFILCQVSKGESLQQILLQKIKRKLQMHRCIKKCTQKQQNVKNMFDDRIQKLSQKLKTR